MLHFAQHSMASTVESNLLPTLGREGLGSQNINSQNINSQNVNSQNVNSQNVNSQNVNSPKILPKSTVWVISQPVRPFHKQEVLITIKLTWDGVTQELEKMGNLEDFKTYLGSYRYDDSKSLPLWNYYTYNESDTNTESPRRLAQ